MPLTMSRDLDKALCIQLLSNGGPLASKAASISLQRRTRSRGEGEKQAGKEAEGAPLWGLEVWVENRGTPGIGTPEV